MSKLVLCQWELPEFINKLMCQSSLINSFSFLFCEFNRVANWNEGKNYDFSTIDISSSQIETLVSYSRSTNVNVNMSFPNSNFEGNFSTYVFGKSFWQYRELKIDCWTSRHILYEKILIPFVCVEFRILIKKWNVYEGHIFSKLQTYYKHVDWKRLPCV